MQHPRLGALSWPIQPRIADASSGHAATQARLRSWHLPPVLGGWEEAEEVAGGGGDAGGGLREAWEAAEEAASAGGVEAGGAELESACSGALAGPVLA